MAKTNASGDGGSTRERSHPRIPVSVQVNVVVSTSEGRTVRVERIGNMSLGGVFVEMRDPPPFGTELTLEFRLTSDHPVIRCKAFVAWSTRNRPDLTDVSGVGVRLTGLSIAEMKQLADFIDSRLSKQQSA